LPRNKAIPLWPNEKEKCKLTKIMRPTKPQSSTAETDKTAMYFRWALHFLLIIAFALTLTNFFVPMGSDWPEALLVVLATMGIISVLTRQLPLQNVLLAAFITALIGGVAHAVGAVAQIPFGPFIFSHHAGPEIFKTLPWLLPFVWVVVVLNSRGTARLILRPWRKTKTYGLWVIGLTSVLTLFFALALDPFASRVKHYWIWTSTKFPLEWYGAPLINFLSWAFVTLLILVLVTPALINKQLSKRSSPDFYPLLVWAGAILVFGVACAQHQLWLAVGVDAAVVVVTSVFAIRGAKW
jgi:uncharacterized membrane protein